MTSFARMEETSIFEFSSHNLLEIDFDRTYSNETGSLTYWRFGISTYDQYSIFGNTFQCHWTSIIETILWRIDGF